jgi:hypothetical protein
MASSLAFMRGKTFAPLSHIMFGSLDFLATAMGELRLAYPDVPVVIGTGPARSARSKAEK